MKQVNIQLPLRMMTLLLGLFLSVGAFAQQMTVKGHVKDAAGEPIIGATIRVAGSQDGVASDFDGNFTIKANAGQMLNVSYIGYQTASVAAAPNVVVTLQEDSQTLQDVVVIGYGRVKKNDLTGSVSAIKPDELSKGITNNAQDMLVGKVAGVDVITGGGTPGGGAQIRIRGGASLNANNDPLVIIDGLAVESNTSNTAKGMSNILAMVNPNDIETFTVLKDASATAIYGSRASNGVIIITTKKGRKGSTTPQVTYNGDFTLSTIAKKYSTLNAAEYRALVAKFPDGLNAANLGTDDTDWQDQIFRTAISTTHNISVSGAVAGIPYRVSGGLSQQNGIVKTSSMDRYNVGVNLAPSFFDDHLNLNISAKFMHEQDRYANAGGAIGSAIDIDPTRPVYLPTTDANYNAFGGFYQPYVNATFADPYWTVTNNPNAPQNPLALLMNQNDRAQANDFNGNVELDYKIHGFEDLHIHANYGGQYTASKERNTILPTSYGNNYYGWDGVERYYKYSITTNLYAQYVKELGAHLFDVMAGAEESHFHRNGWSKGQGTDSYTGAAYNPSTRDETGWATHYSLVSYFGRLNYTLLERYMITATMRADASSRFPDGNRWGYFPSAALAWKISEEPFMKNLSWWNELKLRLSWGQTGQQDIGLDFGYAPLYVVSNSYAMYPFGNTYYNTLRPGAYNKDLKWETTTTWNAGLDFGWLNNRITASADVYYRKTTDLINDVTIPVGTNFASVVKQNIGDLENYGVEFSLNAKPIVTNDFTWDLSYNVSWNHNEITSLTAGADDSYYIKTGSTVSRGNSTLVQAHKVGEAVNAFWVYQQVYDEKGKPIEGMFVDRDGNGEINDGDRYFYKKPAADVIMGLTTKFIYKNWDLSAAFHAALGNYVYYDHLSNMASISAPGLYSNSAFHNTFDEAVNLGFTGQGTQYWLSDYFVRNASYLKCSNITLGYSFPAWLQDEHLSGRVFCTVQNPFFITKYKGLDPEVASGVDRNPYPRPLSVQLGVNLNF